MQYLKFSIGIFIVLASSRFIPHPPNFTALIALGFYIPAFFGLRFIPIVTICFAITDIFLGFHSIIIFTWGSILLIGLLFLTFNIREIKNIKKEIFSHFLIFLILCLFILIAKNHDDFPYYHFPYIALLAEFSHPIGIGQLNNGFRSPSSIFFVSLSP